MAQTAYHQAIDDMVDSKSYHSRSQIAIHCSDDPVLSFAKPTTASIAQRQKKNSVRVMTSSAASLEYGGAHNGLVSS